MVRTNLLVSLEWEKVQAVPVYQQKPLLFFSNVLVTMIKKTKGCPLILAKERLGQIESHINAFPFFWFKRHDTKIYLFSQRAYVYEFVCMYLQFYAICIRLQTGSCIMHQIHSSYCFMVCNFLLQYKSDCNSDTFNKKLDTLPLPLFFFPSCIWDTDHIKLVFKIKWRKSLLNK